MNMIRQQLSLFGRAFVSSAPPEQAKARSRIDKEAPGFAHKLYRAAKKIHQGIAKVVDRFDRLTNLKAREAIAIEEKVQAQKRLEEHRSHGPDEDDGRRGLPFAVYVVLAGVVIFLWWNLDSGALLVALLPLHTTRVLAACIVLVQLALAHTAGVVLRRRHEELDSRLSLGVENVIGVTAVVIGVAIAIVVSAIRMRASDLVVGALFLVVELALFTVMVYAASRVHQPFKSALTWAKAKVWWLERSVEWAGRRLGRAEARVATLTFRFVQVSGRVLARTQMLVLAGNARFTKNHPGDAVPAFPEPGWVEAVADWADGDLPAELTIPNLAEREVGTGGQLPLKQSAA